jgi:glycosyltransferase involved in cell wall biosynthesis
VSRKILIVSLYYPPDLSAGSFRTAALISALRAEEPSLEIDLVTALPHRYSTFSSDCPAHLRDGNLSVHRIKLRSHRSGMLDQARSFTHFAREAGRFARGKRYDLVYATSSRLMTAALGAWISRQTHAPLYLDIRDIFVDTIKDVVPRQFARVMKPVFSLVERWTISRAVHVNVVSGGFLGYFHKRYPRQSFSCFTNGVDDEFVMSSEGAADRSAPLSPVTVLYAGNMGEGQGLHAIVPELAKRMEGRIAFKLIGDGGRRVQLTQALKDAGVRNVQLLAPLSRQDLLHEYLDAHVLFVHLNDYDAFEKVLPSKIFEYAAVGKPIWAGVSGFAAQFLHDEVTNAAVFPPCDAERAIASFETLDLHSAQRPDFVRKFSRRAIMRAMAADILTYVRI